MNVQEVYLKDFFPFLGENERNPRVTAYLPYNMKEMKRQDQKRPCLILCPGGAYAFCSEREDEPVALHFLPEGFNVFVLHYSCFPHQFPTQIREVAALVELIYQNTDKWNCDTQKIAIMGFSAGGHLAAHYSTIFDCPAVREVFPESKAVQATILCYPVITADPCYAHIGSFDNLTGKKDRTHEEIREFSCDCQVRPTTPPAFLWHTAEDAAVPVENSLLYAAALAKNKIPFEAHIFPYGAHGRATCDRETMNELPPKVTHAAEWLPLMKKWLKLMGF